MKMIDRARDIIEMNAVDHYIPFAVLGDQPRLFPMYYARIIGEKLIAFPATNATGIDAALKSCVPAAIMVADREGGFESYLLKGRAHYATDESNYDLVSSMRNLATGFPIHGAVVFEVESVQLVPPP